MIKVQQVHPEATLPPAIVIQVSGLDDLKRMERTINAAINCRPEAGADLFALADDLHAIIARIEEK